MAQHSPLRSRSGLRIRTRSDRCTIYSGTRPQIESLGLVPPCIHWPDDAEAVAWGAGAPACWLQLAHSPTQHYALYVCAATTAQGGAA